MSSQPASPSESSALPPAVRQRLEQVFSHAKRCFEKGDHVYAHDLYTQCVAGDPSNLAYLQHFRANLTKSAGAGKKSSSFGGLLSKSHRGGVDKAAAKGKWEEAFTAGCQALKKHPGDLGVLQAMASACGKLKHTECQLFLLRWALDIDATDVETNRQAAEALSGVGEFDQAIACWRRVQQQKPNDEESAKQIARLSVEKTIHQGGYNADLIKGEGPAPDIPAVRVADLAAKESDGAPRDPRQGSGSTTLEEDSEESFEVREQGLLAKISESPTEPASYLKLADLYAAEDRLQDAERLLNKAVAATGGDDQALKEQLEEIHLRRVRRQVEVAQRRHEKQPNDETKDLLKRMTAQANKAELEVYRGRAARAPGDTRLQFEVGLRQKRLGQFREAIKSFQAARGDSKRAAETQIHLGECFQHIEQYKLAMSSYEAAVEASGGADEVVQKLALYRAGVLAMGIKDLDRAEQRLTDLAGLDFSYRDVAARLDKIASMRKNG